MIRIIKGQAPAHLIRKGTAQTVLDFFEYQKHTNDYNSGVKKFEAKSSIYNSEHVRLALISLQHGKCCYCETKDVRSNTDVEHYRPKAAYSETFGGNSKYPGYFWLAYNWDNLFLSCQVCNQIFKNDFFPITDELTRGQVKAFSILNEVAVFIHPSIDEPEYEIGYRESIPFGKTERGAKTIEYLGFGRVETGKDYSAKQKARIETLVKDRDEHYEDMKYLYNVVQIFSAKAVLDVDEQFVLDGAKAKLANAQLPSAEWSSMIKCAVTNGFKTF